MTTIEAMKQALAEFDRLRRLGMEPSIGNSTGNTIANSAYMTLESAIKREEAQTVEHTQVTCQIYGHVVGACGECNTHAEADVNAANAVLATRYFELLKKVEAQQVAVPQTMKVSTAPSYEFANGWNACVATMLAEPQLPHAGAPQAPMTELEIEKLAATVEFQNRRHAVNSMPPSEMRMLFTRGVEAHHKIGVKP